MYLPMNCGWGIRQGLYGFCKEHSVAQRRHCVTQLISEKMEIDQITHEIIDSAYKVNSTLGQGLLESAYRTCLTYDLRKKGLSVDDEKQI